MDIDAALALVGGYRRWHLLVFCLLSISSFVPMVFHSISIVFIGWTPPHHCALTANQTREEWIPKKADGTYESCIMYSQPSVDNSTLPCTEWYYYDDGYTTMVTEFDLVCDGNYLSDVSQTLLMAASCITDCVASYFTDRFGRRNVHIAMQYALCALGLCVTFTPNYIAMTITRILVGMVTTVVINSGLTMMTEFFDSKRRTFAGIGLEFGWLAVYFMPLPLAYYIKDWRLFMLIASLVPLVFTIYHCILPESASWLVAYNRYDEAEAVLDRIGRYNGLRLPPVHLSRPWEEEASEMVVKVDHTNGKAGKPSSHADQYQLTNGSKYNPNKNTLDKNYRNHDGTKSELERIEARQLLTHNNKHEPELIGEKLSDINRKSYYQNGSNTRLQNGSKDIVNGSKDIVNGSKDIVNGSMTLSAKKLEVSSKDVSRVKPGRVPVTLLFKDPKLRLHLLMANLFWFGNVIVYYGLILNAPNYGNRFLTYLLMGLAEIPAYASALFVVDRFGRRLSMCTYFLLAGITLTVTIFIPRDTSAGKWGVMCLVIFARFAISGSFAIMVLYLRELFPTDVRSSSVAWCGVGGGIGAVSAPIIAYVGKVKPFLPNLIFGIIALIVTLGIIPLPETTDKPLPINLAELYEIYYPSQGGSRKSKKKDVEET